MAENTEKNLTAKVPEKETVQSLPNKSDSKNASIADLLKRVEALEAVVFKPNDKPVEVPLRRNYNTDSGPFAGGSGLNTIK